MSEITITLPDGTKKKHPQGATAHDVAAAIGSRLAKDAVGAVVNGNPISLKTPIDSDADIEIVTLKSQKGLDFLRHSVAHLLAAAVMELYPNTKRTIGPPIEHGFYFDFDFEKPITEADFPKIEAKMREILPTWDEFIRREVSKKEALEEYAGNEFKCELINEFAQDSKTLSFYQSGHYSDLCKGGHVESMKIVKPDAFKLTNLAGAYWRGSEKNKQLTRIYGLAFPTKKELDAHLHKLEEAEKRDHRKLGQRLELFGFDELSPGSPFYFPKGAIVYNELLQFMRAEYLKRGYNEVVTPLIYDQALWKTSGHWEHYKDDMFTVKMDGKDAAIKPMNCPSHCIIYKKKFWSYRELPYRMADFAPLHRNELKGVLGGATRVRKFSQDDAHIFLTEDQLEAEIILLIDFVKFIYEEVFDFDYRLELSTKPDKAMGDQKLWDKAEAALADAMKKKGVDFTINEGDGAFYGPKIDFHIKDSLERSWQLGTIQVDFNLPERFELQYEDADGKRKQPVMVHRALLGSVERFMAILIEHYAGKFPLWLAPEQVRVMSMSDASNEYAQKVADDLQKAGVRAHTDLRTESISKKVRDAQLQYIPLMVTVGPKEIEKNAVAVRTLDGQVKFGISVKDFVSKTADLISKKEKKISL